LVCIGSFKLRLLVRVLVVVKVVAMMMVGSVVHLPVPLAALQLHVRVPDSLNSDDCQKKPMRHRARARACESRNSGAGL